LKRLELKFKNYIKDERMAVGDYQAFARKLKPKDARIVRGMARDEARHKHYLLAMKKKYGAK
jgi:hypothetical protein